MYIFRYIFGWLMKRPMLSLAAYLLMVGALLFNMFAGGGSSDDVAEISKSAEQVETADMKDLTVTPKIEPSSLTTALVKETEDDAVEGQAQATDIVADETTEVEVATESKNEATTESTTEATIVTTIEEEVSNTTEVPLAEAQAAITTEEASEPAAAAVDTEANTVSVDDDAENTTPEVEVDASEEAVNAEFSEVNADEMLLMAREAYWNNGLDESAQIYKELIQLKPEVIEYRGELGNVFWRQGYPKRAAELYASIALPMIESGNSDRVANMVGFIGLYYPEKATEIHNRLQAEQK